jgi:type IV pilus assembly protein PilC
MTRALQKHSNIFSPVYIALIRAGEMAGAMGEILDRLAVLLEREYSLKKKVQSALTYPAFVFLISMAITVFLVLYIFPQFVSLLEGLDLKLPWPTVFLIHVTNAMKNIFVLTFLFIVLGVGVYMSKQYFSTPLGKRQAHRFLLEAPIVGPITRKVAISRLCRTLGTLLSSGVPLIHSLDVVGKVAGNDVVSDILDEVKMSLKSGERLSTPLMTYPLFPPMLYQMVAVGEETGNLPQLLEKLADFYDTEVEAALDAFIVLTEPLMILFMGGLVGFVMLSVFLPVYTILQRF